MKKIVLFLIVTLSFYSCQTSEIQVVEEVFNDGAIKSIVDYRISFGDSIPIHRLDFHKDGSKRMEGFFKDGERDGEWLSWFTDGTVWSKGYFKEGKRTGKSWVYHPNGKLYIKGKYEDGKKTGQWLVFDEDGILLADQSF